MVLPVWEEGVNGSSRSPTSKTTKTEGERRGHHQLVIAACHPRCHWPDLVCTPHGKDLLYSQDDTLWMSIICRLQEVWRLMKYLTVLFYYFIFISCTPSQDFPCGENLHSQTGHKSHSLTCYGPNPKLTSRLAPRTSYLGVICSILKPVDS